MIAERKNPIKFSKYLIRMALFSFIYFILARLGLSLATINKSVSPVWPATGFAFGILLLEGIEYWPSILLGAFTINYLMTGQLITASFITIGNTLEGIIGFLMLKYFFERSHKFGAHSRTIGIVSASLIGALFSSSIGTMAIVSFDQTQRHLFQNMWLTWFTGDALGGFTFLPLILSFSKKLSTDYSRKNPSLISVLALIICGLFLCWVLFIKQEGSPYLFFVFPYMFWCVAVAGERGATLSTLSISLAGFFSVNMGYGLFTHGDVNSNLMNLQLFLASVAVSSLMMSDFKRSASLKKPAIVLLFSWILAGLFFLGFYIRSVNESNKHFQELVDSVAPIIEDRINYYFSALRSGSGLFSASEDVDREEWKIFLDHGQYKLPGADGIGVIFYIHKKNLAKFVKETQADNASDFTYQLYPGISKNEITNARSRDYAYIITFMEPRDQNKEKIGVDISSEETRRIAAELARDTGGPAVSSRATILGDPKKQTAFIIYYPFYTKGSIPIDVKERREKIQGWIYAPIVMAKFFESVFSMGNFKGLSYSVFENEQDKNSLVGSSPDFNKLPSEHILSRNLKVGNKIFYCHFKRSKDFYSAQDTLSSWTGAISSIISLVIGTFIVSLQVMRTKALELAERKTQDLRASEELWKFALEGAGDSVWDWNISSNKIKFSKKSESILGYTVEEINGDIKEWRKKIHPDDMDRVLSSIKSSLQTNTNYVSEYRILCKDGNYKWILSRGMVVEQDPKGKPLRMVGTISDISRWKENEFEIDRQRSKLHSIFEGSSDALILLSPEGFFDCNKQTLELFGVETKEEFLKLKPSDISPPFQPDGIDSQQKSNNLIQNAFDQGINHFEWIIKRKNGETVPVEILLTAFTYDNKRVLQACVRDISERKKIESALFSQREKLMAASKMSSLGEMAGGIAHEINNPLAIIIGKINQLQRRIKNKEESNLTKYDSDLAVVENTAKRISSIIKGLSSFSRNAENDKMDKVIVSSLIQDTLGLAKERFRFQSIDLKSKFECDEKTYVFGKTSQLLQVLINLLNNACDAVENLHEKWVEIKVTSTETTCIISVTDSGPGIPPDVLEKIMTPFFTTKEVGKGTGLGLSISRNIIEEHHGKLYYDKTSPHTRFVIELPIAHKE